MFECSMFFFMFLAFASAKTSILDGWIYGNKNGDLHSSGLSKKNGIYLAEGLDLSPK